VSFFLDPGRVLWEEFKELMMSRLGTHLVLMFARALAPVGLGFVAMSCSPRLPVERILAGYQENGSYPEVSFRSPLDGTLFPPEIVPCTFAWQDATKADTWLVLVETRDGPQRLCFVSPQVEWRPKAQEWKEIKERSREKRAKVTVLGFRRAAPLNLLSRGRIAISTSKDVVGAPLFYREVNLPFKEAVKDPSLIRWRFGTIDSEPPPPVVLERLPVCGNCHSFSQAGRMLGMDVDYANNKGSYVVTAVARNMVLASSDIMTWDNYKPEDHQKTYGLLSQVSPDGQVVVSTVKDKSVFVATPDLAFSQLFFPIKGILALYRRNSGAFQSLPGADDPAYVQSNPSWSPDGKYLVFARAKAYELRNKEAENKLLLTEAECAEFLRDGKPFLFDLYRIPYNDGQGGKAEPLAGASRNGRSNYFAKYSPDGRWIVFCQARSYMLLQPDSELYIIPAEGGAARRLQGNTSRMNSWHSWSPNSRWLVFSSKCLSPYTQLFLTHIDEQGQSTPPVLLARFTAPDRAANIPEFVNTAPGSIARIQEQFIDDLSHARAAYVLENSGDFDGALQEYQKALGINSKNVHAHQRLGFILYKVKGNLQEGLAHTTEALRLDPNDACAHFDMGVACRERGQLEQAVRHLTKAVALMPEGFDRRYNPCDMRCVLGDALVANGDARGAATVLAKAVSLNPQSAGAHYLLALALAAQGLIQEPAEHYSVARGLLPGIDTIPELHLLMSVNYQKAGQIRAALGSAQTALAVAQAKGDAGLVQSAKDRLGECRQNAGRQ
jgi:tetratricopeptide (TPR) repeat protein